MMRIARNWRVLVGGVTVGVALVLGFADATASAEPVLPPLPNPAPPTVTQPVTVAPGNVANSTFGTAPAPGLSPLPAGAGAVPPRTAPGLVAAPLPAGVPAAAPPQPTMVPAASGTIRDYLQSKGVQLEPQKPEGFQALDITLPMPPRWTRVPDPNVVDPFVVIANRSGSSLYTSNAQLVVYKLIGDFDPQEAITHGFVDSQQLTAWRSTGASLADFGGFRSSIIVGTYRQNAMMLNTSHRHVIATSGPDRYLLSLSVTTAANQAVAEAPATDAIVNGFRVAVPGSSPAPAPAGPPAPAPQQPAPVPLAGPAVPTR